MLYEVITVDGDGQHPAEAIPTLITAIRNNEADIQVTEQIDARNDSRTDESPCC